MLLENVNVFHVFFSWGKYMFHVYQSVPSFNLKIWVKFALYKKWGDIPHIGSGPQWVVGAEFWLG